jgi:ankyrin repeat protein
MSALHKAVMVGNLQKVEGLLKGAFLRAPADVNEADDQGNTPLHWAAIGNEVEIAQLLLSKGADLNATDPQGLTPLTKATFRGNAEIAELLVAHGGQGWQGPGEEDAKP